MTGMIMHSRGALDNDGNPRQGPQIGVEAMCACAFAKRDVQSPEQLLIQLRFPASPAGTLQPGTTSAFPLLIPTTYALATNTQLPRDGRQHQLSTCEQTRRMFASLLKCIEISPLSSKGRHESIILQDKSFVTLLCEVQ
jgi:hypothetical protein